MEMIVLVVFIACKLDVWHEIILVPIYASNNTRNVVINLITPWK